MLPIESTRVVSVSISMPGLFYADNKINTGRYPGEGGKKRLAESVGRLSVQFTHLLLKLFCLSFSLLYVYVKLPTARVRTRKFFSEERRRQTRPNFPRPFEVVFKSLRYLSQ